jgi:hypothetical protein
VEQSRRDFLRTTAKAGAVVWAVPVITTVNAGPAWAQTAGTGPPPPQECCTASAYGLRVIIPLLSIDNTLGVDGCVVDTGVLGSAAVATVRATAVCGETSKPAGGPCTATASVASLTVTAGTTTIAATVLGASASAACSPNCNTAGDAQIVSLNLNGQVINVGTGPNFGIAGIIVFDEQICSSGLLTVNALHITIPGVVEVIVSHTVVGAQNCACPAA